MSVKLLRFEKKVFTEGSGALISICVLKEDFTRNIRNLSGKSERRFFFAVFDAPLREPTCWRYQIQAKAPVAEDESKQKS